MSVQTEQETLGMLRTLIDLLEKKAEATGVKLRELKDRELSHQEMQEWLRFLKGITNDGKIAPRSALLKKEDRDRCEYIMNQAKLHKKDELFKVLNNDDGTVSLLTNDEGWEFFAYHNEIFDIAHPDRAGEIREVSLANDIAAGVDDRSKTIIKGLTEAQYLALTKKVYTAENRFTFCSAVHEKDGVKTYDIVVNAKNFMYGDSVKGKHGANDLFSFLIANGAFENKESEEAIKKENELMNKILNYDGDEPMYVTQLYKGDEFLMVTKDKVTVINRNLGRIEINKNEMDTKSFQVNVLRYFDKFSIPFELTDEICDKLGINKETKFDTCLNHARTGRDEDFIRVKDGKAITPVPINRNEMAEEVAKYKEMIVTNVKAIEMKCFEQATQNYIKESKNYVNNNVLASIEGMDKDAAVKILSAYERNLKDNIREYNPVGTNCFWNKVQTKALEDALNAYNQFNKTNYALNRDVEMPENINKLLKDARKDTQQVMKETVDRMKDAKMDYAKFHDHLQVEKSNAVLNKIKEFEEFSKFGSKFLENNLRNNEPMDVKYLAGANMFVDSVVKIYPEMKEYSDKMLENTYHDLVNNKSAKEIYNNIQKEFNIDVEPCKTGFPSKQSTFIKFVFDKDRSLNDSYNSLTDYEKKVLGVYGDLTKSLIDTDLNYSAKGSKDNEYYKEATAWYEEAHSKMVLSGNGDELVVAYMKELVYTEDEGPLADVPDKIDGSITMISNLEIEHTAIDYRGVCIDEVHQDEKLYDLMGYDDANLEHDNTISSMNAARATNKNIQNTNEKLYRSVTTKSDRSTYEPVLDER